MIARHGAGLEAIDLAAATEYGVQVTNAPIANSHSVVEHVIGMMLVLAKNFLVVDRELRATGTFDVRDHSRTFDLAGRTLGIVGLGNVGSRLAKRAHLGFDMPVLGYDPVIDCTSMEPYVEIVHDINLLFARSDFISLHVPLNDSTKGFIGIDQFKRMKQTVFIINCARGAIIKEPDLIEALERNMIAGAGIDVYDPYIPGKDHPFFSFDNVILTPHSAAFTDESLLNMATHAAQGIIEVLNSQKPTWPANHLDGLTERRV